MKKKKGKRKKQLQRKYFMKKLLITEGCLLAAALIVLTGVTLVKHLRDSARTVSMVQAPVDQPESTGIDMETTDSLAQVKAAMAKPTEFSPSCLESTDPSLYIQSTEIEVNGQTLTNVSDYHTEAVHTFDAGINYTDVD